MAGDPSRLQTSAEIADHAGTNPVVVRRVLGRLREAGLLVSEKGHAGGWRLSKSPQEITLADVYVALDESLVASMDDTQNANKCSVEDALHRRVRSVMQEVEENLISRLRETTIAEVRGSGA